MLAAWDRVKEIRADSQLKRWLGVDSLDDLTLPLKQWARDFMELESQARREMEGG